MTITSTTKRTSREDGFSLIEVLIAIVILTVGLLSLAQMMVLSTKANTLSGRMTSCSGVAKERLERLKAVPFYADPGRPSAEPATAPRRRREHDDSRILPTLRCRWIARGWRERALRGAVADSRRRVAPSDGDASHPNALSAGERRFGSVRRHRRRAVHDLPYRQYRLVQNRRTSGAHGPPALVRKSKSERFASSLIASSSIFTTMPARLST